MLAARGSANFTICSTSRSIEISGFFAPVASRLGNFEQKKSGGRNLPSPGEEPHPKPGPQRRKRRCKSGEGLSMPASGLASHNPGTRRKPWLLRGKPHCAVGA